MDHHRIASDNAESRRQFLEQLARHLGAGWSVTTVSNSANDFADLTGPHSSGLRVATAAGSTPGWLIDTAVPPTLQKHWSGSSIQHCIKLHGEMSVEEMVGTLEQVFLPDYLSAMAATIEREREVRSASRRLRARMRALMRRFGGEVDKKDAARGYFGNRHVNGHVHLFPRIAQFQIEVPVQHAERVAEALQALVAQLEGDSD